MELRTKTRAIQVSTYDHSTAFVFVLCFFLFYGSHNPISWSVRALNVGPMQVGRTKYPLWYTCLLHLLDFYVLITFFYLHIIAFRSKLCHYMIVIFYPIFQPTFTCSTRWAHYPPPSPSVPSLLLIYILLQSFFPSLFFFLSSPLSFLSSLLLSLLSSLPLSLLSSLFTHLFSSLLCSSPL